MAMSAAVVAVTARRDGPAQPGVRWWPAAVAGTGAARRRWPGGNPVIGSLRLGDGCVSVGQIGASGDEQIFAGAFLHLCKLAWAMPSAAVAGAISSGRGPVGCVQVALAPSMAVWAAS